MKKFLFVFGFYALICMPCTAAVKMCVPNVATAACSGAQVIGSNEWEMTCGGVKIYGLAYCSDMTRINYAIADVSRKRVASDSVISVYNNANKYCWCSMVAPFRSGWYYATNVAKGASTSTTDTLNTFSSAGQCNTNCAAACSTFWAGNNSVNSLNDEGVRDHVFRVGV